MPTPQTGRVVKQTSPKASPVKTANKATIAKAFDNQSSGVKARVRQWQEQGGGVKTAPEIFTEAKASGSSKVSASSGTSPPSTRKAPSAKSKTSDAVQSNVLPTSNERNSGDGPKDAEHAKTPEASPTPESAAKLDQAANLEKKREISAAKLRLAQAILGPSTRPSERLRRLSEARKDAEAKREKEAKKEAEAEAKREADAKKEAEEKRQAEAKKQAQARKQALIAAALNSPKSGTAGVAQDHSGKSQEAGTPKKRIISDGHWRSKRTPPKDTDIPPPPPKPTVEGWLEGVPSEDRESGPDDGIRVTAISDTDAQRERDRRHEERRRKRRERVEARRAAYGRSSSSVPSTVEPSETKTSGRYEDETKSQPEQTLDSTSTWDASTERGSRFVKSEHQRTLSAPVSVEPADDVSLPQTRRRHATAAATPPHSHLSYSSQDDSDNLTSISRRPPPRTSGSKQKKSIFTHAAKIFSKPEPKVDISADIPPGPARVPTIESWLNHATDPFIATVDEEEVEVPAPLSVKSRDRSPSSRRRASPNASEEWSRESSKSLPPERIKISPKQRHEDATANDAADVNKKKRLRRVIRHRDGTVTTEDVDEGPDVPDSPTLRRRGAQRRDSPRAQRRSRQDGDAADYSDDFLQTDIEPSIDVADDDIPEDLSFVGRTRRPLASTGKGRNYPQDTKDPVLSRRRKAFTSDGQKGGPDSSHGLSNNLGSRHRRLAKHSDLISVLSSHQPTGTSIRSARSIRTYRSRLDTATIDDILHEFASDEVKYMRELYTVVDGVIPVLLSNSLSSKSSLVTSNLFQSASNDAAKETLAKTIFDMGMALEKLKGHHAKAPSTSPGALMSWAKTASRFYTEYLRVWRVGFQDVVVNLAAQDGNDEAKTLDKGLPRDSNGDVVDSNGERVDVAFLLKRPLVRLKYLAKTMHGINHLQPSHQAEDLSGTYRDLVEHARKRSNEERSRLEDQTAASTDATKARDPRTLAPVDGVVVAGNRHVKARDTFVLNLQHSSGQRLDCTVELALRSDPPDIGNAGDLLIAEIDGTGRWLLFPPLHVDQLSARSGDGEDELVMMVKGEDADGCPWHELMLLTSDEENVSREWVQLLGLQPVPPSINRPSNFVSASSKVAPTINTASATSNKTGFSSSVHMEVPIGERAQGAVKRWKDTSESRIRKRHSRYSPSTIVEETMSTLDPVHGSSDQQGSLPTPGPELEKSDRLPRNLNEAMRMAGSPHSGLKRARAQRQSKASEEANPSPAKIEALALEGTESRLEPNNTPSPLGSKPTTPSRYHLAQSLTPSMKLPNIPKRRTGSSPGGSTEKLEAEVDWQGESNRSSDAKLNSQKQLRGNISLSPGPNRQSTPTSARGHRRTSSPLKHEYAPSEACRSADDSDTSTVVHDLSSPSDSSSSDSELEDSDTQSVLVPISAIGRYRKAPRNTPPESLADGTLSPSQSASQAPYREVPAQPEQGRRATASLFFWSDKGSWQILWPENCVIVVSPGLIEAYEGGKPQSGTTSPTSFSRETNRRSPGLPKGQLLLGLELTPLVPIRRGTALDISVRSPPTPDSKATANGNNNFLFRSRTPEDCEILYTLINHARINNPTYIALQNARATSFNPTFQGVDRKDNSKLAKASSWFGLGRKNSYRAASSVPTPSVSKNTESSVGSMSSALSALRNIGRGSGRFNIARSTITSRQGSGNTSMFTSSEGTASSGTSASSMFNGQPADGSLGLNNCKIRLYLRESTSKWADLGSARLTIMRPNSGLQSSTPGAPAPVESGHGVPIEHVSSENTAGHGLGMKSSGGYASLGNKVTATDKRIVVTGIPKASGASKDKEWQTMLDATLGETCFERVARTGIAVSVWENFEGGMVAKQGGVNAGRVRVYMMQFKNEADTAYTYSIVGKLRY